MSTITPIVAQHYNSLQEKGIDARKDSRIYHMRAFNNWIKSMLISDAIKELPYQSELTVFDLCCGKGGDIQKWVKAERVSHVVFADIANQSVEQCRERFTSLHKKGGITNAEFVTGDATSETLCEKFRDPTIQFDLVSVQFSFHYCFESLNQALKMLENVSRNLKKGGFFIGTTTNANRIVARLQQQKNPKTLSNPIFNINFNTEFPFPIFGAQYTFQLDEVVNCPEFLVNFPTLEKLASRFGLRLKYKMPFDEFFNTKVVSGKFLLERMQALQTFPLEDGSAGDFEYKHAVDFLRDNPSKERLGTLSKSEWEAVSLYVVFCFEKV